MGLFFRKFLSLPQPQACLVCVPHDSHAALEVFKCAFESAGVEFIDENGGGAEVRLRKPPQGKPRK
jgi:hypothetical protein